MFYGSRPLNMTLLALSLTTALLVGPLWPRMGARSMAQDGGTITLKSDVQEANSITGVITARGNVQIDYPARQIYATSAQAQYFSNERRIVLSGNVEVLQEGNRLRAETITYLIDEGRFVALPQPNEQVESIYVLPEPEPGSAAEATPTPVPPPAEPPASLDISPVDGGQTTAPEKTNPSAPLSP
jgi:lipopolysaccharide export system protein LptA